MVKGKKEHPHLYSLKHLDRTSFADGTRICRLRCARRITLRSRIHTHICTHDVFKKLVDSISISFSDLRIGGVYVLYDHDKSKGKHGSCCNRCIHLS